MRDELCAHCFTRVHIGRYTVECLWKGVQYYYCSEKCKGLWLRIMRRREADTTIDRRV